ncbi:MAG: hypothetical protein QJR03_03320 [Sphaerobacter sp.]|nr:hypothetical protein [Sphaerobacter sp.]
MTTRARRILALTAAAFATGTFPFNPVAAIGWLAVAILVLPEQRPVTEVVWSGRLRKLLSRRR